MKQKTCDTARMSPKSFRVFAFRIPHLSLSKVAGVCQEAYWVDKHGEGAWDNNHRVWVLTFVLVEPELELDQVRVDENAEFVLINGTKFDLLKCPDNRLLLTTIDYLSQEHHHDKMLECEALRLRDWLLAMYPL